MEQLLQHLLNGLVLGGTYALLGIGLTLIFGLMNVVNFAHGEFYTLGAYVSFAGLALAGAGFFVALLAAIVAGAALGWLCEVALLRPLRNESIDTTMLVMIGVWIAMQNAELLGWGGVAKSIPHPFPTAPLVLGPIGIAPLRLFVLVLAAELIAASWLLVQKTKLGRAMRATFQDRDTAALMGASIGRIHAATFAFGAALAGSAAGSWRRAPSRYRSGSRAPITCTSSSWPASSACSRCRSTCCSATPASSRSVTRRSSASAPTPRRS